MAQDISARYSPEPSVIEARAADWIDGYRRARGTTDAPTRRLRATTRRVVLLAMGAGILSGVLIGGSEIWMRESFGLEDADFWEALPLWIAWFAIAGVISAIEIAFLYWIALRGIGAVIATARVEIGESGYPGLVARGFARGALEFPNPRGDIFGIDPYAYVPGWQLVLRTVAYKLKVGVSSFILRVFLRRVATRLAIRGLVPLMAGPLYAAWNAIIIWRIMIEARLRAYGPAAIDAVLDRCFGEGALSDEAREALLHGTGEIVRRAGDMHPNYVYLVGRLRERLDLDVEAIEVDWPARRDRLRELDEGERRQVLCVLVLAAVLGSRTKRKQREAVDEAFEAAGLERADDAFKALRRALAEGRLEVPDHLDRAIEGARKAA